MSLRGVRYAGLILLMPVARVCRRALAGFDLLSPTPGKVAGTILAIVVFSLCGPLRKCLSVLCGYFHRNGRGVVKPC